MQSQNRLPQPPEVGRAITLLWVGLGLMVLKVAVNIGALDSIVPSLLSNAAFLLTFGIAAFIIYATSKGYNWARWSFALMFAVDALPALYLLPETMAQSPLRGGITLAQCAAQGYGLYLLFSFPGKAWFRKAEDS